MVRGKISKMKDQVAEKRNLQGLGLTGDLKIQGYPYSLTLYQLSYPETC